MLRLFSQRTIYLIITFFLTFGTGITRADDTEIYFSSGSSSANTSNPILPNVLLILDTSGSMNIQVPNTGGKTRMEVMKDSMKTIIDSIQDVNVGLMRFTFSAGGAVVYPIAGIDDPTSETVSEPDDSLRKSLLTIITSSDDAQEELVGNTVTLNDPILNMNTKTTGGDITSARVNRTADDASECTSCGGFVSIDQRFGFGFFLDERVTLGMRFRGLNIPSNASITFAELSLSSLVFNGSTTAIISGEDIANCADYSGPSRFDLTNRRTPAETTAKSTLTFNSTPLPTMNVTSVISELVNTGAGTDGKPLCLFGRANGFRANRLANFEQGRTNAPFLQVSYTTPGSAATLNQKTGLRFQNVVVPKGATITDAKLILTSISDNAATTNRINISAEQVDDATTFTNNASDISNRVSGSSKTTTWNLPTTIGDAQVTSCTDGSCTGDALTAVIQQITDRANWCGGNDLNLLIEFNSGNVDFYSFDGDSGKAPKLEITYDTKSSLGCVQDTESAQISRGSDDAENSTIGGSVLNLRNSTSVGMRFLDIDVPQGATILEASLSFTPFGTRSGNSTITFHGEKQDNPTTYGDVTTRTKTNGSASWNAPTFQNGNVLSTPNLKTIVQELVDSSGWASGNPMAFILETSGNERRVRSFNSDASKAPRLSIRYQSNGNFSPSKRNRQRLVEIIDAFPASGLTPITETLYEAAHYWRGESVTFGTSRSEQRTTRLSHPGSYCDGDNDCNGANTGTFPPYGIVNPAGCDVNNLDNFNCRNRSISGAPNYVSPFVSELSCASNYQVLLTDGAAFDPIGSPIAPVIESEFTDIGSCRNRMSNNSFINDAQDCAIDLVKFLAEKDQSATLPNDQTITTHVVGFSLTNQFLQDIASEGKGEFFRADNASDLITAFDTILTSVKNNPTSIISPSLATNAFNRLFSREDVYFGLFTPELNSTWLGNIKKYKVCTKVGTPAACDFVTRILDGNDEQAVNEFNRFKTTTQDVWSAGRGGDADGVQTTKGGVGEMMRDFGDRIIYTDTTGSPPNDIAPSNGQSLESNQFKITKDSWNSNELSTVREHVCPNPSTSANSDCEDRMLWMLGKVIDSKVDDASDIDATTRWTVNDVLHSSPVTITYNGRDTNNDGVINEFFDKIIVGTNDGALKMINAKSGKEDWSFIPQPLLELQQSLFANAEGTHNYGVDLSPVVKIIDVNKNGKVEPDDGDKVHAYFGMRRGGVYYYALDLTGTITQSSTTFNIIPKFLWRIQGNKPDVGGQKDPFKFLTNTWSLPESTRILTTSGGEEAFIFGGGYDTNLDNGFGTTPTAGNNNKGNMIFIVNPETGNLIFSIGGDNTNATLKVPQMKYSFAAAPELLDTNGDGLTNRIYIADTGGQIWRVDFNGDINHDGGAASAGSTVIGLLAQLSTEGTPADERRFFETPEVAAVLDTRFTAANKQKYFLVAIGSGDRAHPLIEIVDDQFYGLRDFEIGNMVGGNGAEHIARNYPKNVSGVTSPIIQDDLIDVSNAILSDNDTVTDASFGWFIDFTETGHPGEKVLTSPIIVAGNVFITTYEPDVTNNTDLCAANLGGGRLLGLNVLTTGGFNTPDVDGREISDQLRGLSSAVIPFYAADGIYGLIGVEGGLLQNIDTDDNSGSQGFKLSDNPFGRTYWSEK